MVQATPSANSAGDSTATPHSIPAGSNTADSSLLPIPPAAVEAKSLCQGHLKPLSSSHESLCEKAQVSDLCLSQEGLPIYALHIEPASRFTAQARTIISLSLIHGDEEPSLELNLRWLERLSRAQDVRNRWIFIPVANPDGYQKKTRTNSRGVDLNRNFPTKDWDELALKQWEQGGKIPRRYPGTQAGSEPETQCLIRLINEAKPHLIVSIHTPLKVLDFDGPNSVSPISILLPWRRLGHYPGSMGRYYWHERNIPVLTVELGPKLEASKTQLEQLQDQIGQLAYRLSAKPR
ncbi:MAG: DUF2817 domain-containing protein, partial [Bdellovibrionaceae bacterium]|jgi:hypothetical protein|nr:DUF2817 domain-containing protein [Pseudobdellovibrionaceae bacterium]